MKTKYLLIAAIFSLGACSLFEKEPEEGGNTGGGYPDPARVCTQITEENKAQITAEYGRSCKVGDFLSKGAPTCSSTLEKCMSKKY
jgi:hypothetical protein